MKYTIREDANFGKVLQKDGVDTFCPFQPSFPNGDRLFRLPCSSLCPHAKYESNERCDMYLVSCSGITEPFHIEKR